MTSPEHAFQELASVFSSRGNKILEIEILPPSLGSPLLQDGCSVGITKKALIQAYTVARHLLVERLMRMSEQGFGASLLEKKTASDGIQDSVITEIALLFDCEHLTACNWRKRRLLAAVSLCPNAADLLETELTLMTSFQCSPLHRHTKSPTLWSHRLWVLKQLFQVQPWDREALLSLERAELDTVLRAGELHPKNYYAFSYMRQLHAFLANVLEDVQDRPGWTVELGRTLVDPVLNWCLANPKDISGWMFAKYLLDNVREVQIRTGAIARVLRFARDVGWEGESLWTFIDQAARQYGLEYVVDDILQHGLKAIAPDTSVSHQYTVQRWPWKAQLAKVRTYWALHGQSDNLR